MSTIHVLTLVLLSSLPFLTEPNYMTGIAITAQEDVFFIYSYWATYLENSQVFVLLKFDISFCGVVSDVSKSLKNEQETFKKCIKDAVKSLKQGLHAQTQPSIKFLSFESTGDSISLPEKWTLETVGDTLKTLLTEIEIEAAIQPVSRRVEDFLHYISAIRDKSGLIQIPSEPMVKISNFKITFVMHIPIGMEDPPAYINYVEFKKSIKFYTESFDCNGLHNMRYLMHLHLAIDEQNKAENADQSRNIILNDPCLVSQSLQIPLIVDPKDECYNINKYPFLLTNKYEIQAQFNPELCLELIYKSLTDTNVCYNEQCLQLTQNYFITGFFSKYDTFKVVHGFNFDDDIPIHTVHESLGSLGESCELKSVESENSQEHNDLCLLHFYILALATYYPQTTEQPRLLKYTAYSLAKFAGVAYVDERVKLIEEVTSTTAVGTSSVAEPSVPSDTKTLERPTPPESFPSTLEGMPAKVDESIFAVVDLDESRVYRFAKMKYKLPRYIDCSMRIRETLGAISTIVLGVIAYVCFSLMLFSMYFTLKNRSESSDSSLYADL